MDKGVHFAVWHCWKHKPLMWQLVSASFAISEYSKQKNSRLNFDTVVSGDELQVAGMKYLLILNVNDGCNEGTIRSKRQKYTNGLGMIIGNSFT
ncbi:hypothetical protein YC2023_040933 [Brassica napus]